MPADVGMGGKGDRRAGLGKNAEGELRTESLSADLGSSGSSVYT